MIAFVAMTTVFACAAGLMVYFAFDIPRAMATAIGAATVATWALAIVAYWVAHRIAATSFDRKLVLVAAPDLHSSISYLSRLDPRRVVSAEVSRWERRSIAWPLMGIATVAPLLIHYLFAGVMGGELPGLDEFGLWVGLAALIVGHVHYFVGAQGASFARDVGQTPDEHLPLLEGRGWRALIVGVGASLMPGLAALGIPCVVVALTGLLFLPLSYRAMHAIAMRERRMLRVND
jgi:hypothetical protein